jgi:hypothetical protein
MSWWLKWPVYRVIDSFLSRWHLNWYSSHEKINEAFIEYAEGRHNCKGQLSESSLGVDPVRGKGRGLLRMFFIVHDATGVLWSASSNIAPSDPCSWYTCPHIIPSIEDGLDLVTFFWSVEGDKIWPLPFYSHSLSSSFLWSPWGRGPPGKELWAAFGQQPIRKWVLPTTSWVSMEVGPSPAEPSAESGA